MSARLGAADARLGLLRLGSSALTGGPGAGGGFVDRSWGNDAWPDALVRRTAARRRDVAWLVAAGSRGDVVRPDAADPLPAGRPVWHTPFSQPVPAPVGRLPRHRTWEWWVIGQPPREEDITPDKWHLPTQLPGRPPRNPLCDCSATDTSHLGDAEDVFLEFDVPMEGVRLRRPAPLIFPDARMLTAELIPEDPVAQNAPWHVAFTQRPAPRAPRHLLPEGVWTPSEALAPEAPGVDKFGVPLGRVVQRRPRLLDSQLKGPDEPEEFRAEVVQIAALGPMGQPSRRAPLTQLPGALVILPELSFEAPHADALHTDNQPPGLLVRRPSAGIYESARTELIIAENFGQPNIAILHKYQLSGGLWRARL